MHARSECARRSQSTRRRSSPLGEQPTRRRRCRARASRLSPLNRRRWQNFKANRRGYWSFWIFLVLFVLSLFAEFIANDRPIIASYKGETPVPGLRRLSGGEVRRLPGRDRLSRSRRSQDEIDANGWMIWPPIRFSYDTHNNDLPTPAPAQPDLDARPTRNAAASRDANGVARPATAHIGMELARHRRPGPRRGRAR